MIRIKLVDARKRYRPTMQDVVETSHSSGDASTPWAVSNGSLQHLKNSDRSLFLLDLPAIGH